MKMEETSPRLLGMEFVRQYYTLLKRAPECLHRFHGSHSSYVHGRLDPNGNRAEPAYGQVEIHKKVMSLKFSQCRTKIRHVDAHDILSGGVVVQVLGELSNSGQPMRKFVQTFVLAPEGSVANKLYVNSNIFHFVDEFGDSDAELDEVLFLESEEDVEPEPEPEELKSEGEKKVLEEMESPVPVESPPNTQEAPKTLSWAQMSSRNLPPAGTVTPSLIKVKKPRVESKSEVQMTPLPPREQRTRDRRSVPPRGPRSGGRDGDSGDVDNRRSVQYPDNHQLFVGNLPHDSDESELKELFMTYGNVVDLQINTRNVGGKFANFGFVVFDDSDTIERILRAEEEEPIMFRGDVRLNVEEKKTKPVLERGRREMRRRDWGPGASRGIVGRATMRERNGGRDGDPGDMDNKRSVRYPDNQQLFVGNLPHDSDESELQELFMTYGNVVDLQINTRNVGGKFPNFGFVVFDDSDTVERILGAESIMIRGDVRLNVEEKKTKAVLERGSREMRRNSRGPGASRRIVGSGTMPERNGGRDLDNRRNDRYPDNHQLFVGNLPHDSDENELKELFMTYGNVVDLQINTRNVGGKLPNFGFVVFDDSDPIQRILEAEPIMLRGDVCLNVEEKTTKAVLERESREMRRNYQGAGASRRIVGSGTMHERKGGRDGDPGDVDNRRNVRYPDNHQLFVGNLPHDSDESELWELFMTYGNVVDLQINTRNVGGELPNFGFVVFDDSDTVERILWAEPIMFRDDVRLNVEERKTRAVLERERREMRLNDRGPGGSRCIKESAKM